MARLGVLGGTFDPPHMGHLNLAQTACKQLALDTVLWVPAGQPPHKHHQTPASNFDKPCPAGRDAPSAVQHRLAMTQLTIAEHPQFALCRLDLDRPGPHYTADLLALLQAQYGPFASFWFLVGEDSLRDLAKWRSPERILDICRLAVYPRPGPPILWDQLEQLIPDIREKIDWLDGPPLELASSLIRKSIRKGQPIQQVPAAVSTYIETHKLYKS